MSGQTTCGDKRIGMIWAQDANGCIGDGEGMCWNVPADYAHFKNTTMGAPIVMGRKSFEALGAPLPGRENVVITRDKVYRAPGATVVHSPQEALDHLADAPLIWITGGAQIYRAFMDVATHLLVSYLDCTSGATLKAPDVSLDEWVVDKDGTDEEWRPVSGDARWRVVAYRRPAPDMSEKEPPCSRT